MFKIDKLSSKQLRYFFVVVWIVIFLIISFSGYFLYQNFYKVILESGEVVILEGNDSLERINIDKIKNVLEQHKEKIEPRSVNVNFNF